MTKQQFQTWAERHCNTFAFDLAANAPTFVQWFDVFQRSGYAIAELNAATDAIAMRPDTTHWLRDHLPQIHAAVRRARANGGPQSMEHFREHHGLNVPDAEIAKAGSMVREYLDRIGYRSRRSRKAVSE